MPERQRGCLFEYEIIRLTREGPIIRYNDQVYQPMVEQFEYFKETEESQTMSYPRESLDGSHEQWQRAQAKVNARLYKERETLKAAQAAASAVEESKFDVSDIEEYYAERGRGTHLLEYEFDADTPEPCTYISEKSGLSKTYWCWTHKLTRVSVKRFATASGKSCDSGRLSKYLGSITNRQHPRAHCRAQKILALNESVQQTTEISPIALERRDLLKQQVSCVVVDCCLTI